MQAHKFVRVALAACMLATTFGVSAQQSSLPAAVGDTPMPSLAPMIKRVSPAVVNIATRGTIRQRGPQNPLLDDPFFRRFFDIPNTGPREREFQSAGSGVIVDARAGYIVTNAHVVENASEITVTLMDGRDLKATVVGADAATDVAILKVPAQGLVQITLGNSERVEVGDFVVAIGNPFGLQHTVTSGIVSGLGRSGINPEGYENFIQTDASINPGNSGGALVNLRGELIGVNSAILSRSGGNIGIGFAIPTNMTRSVMDQLVKYGTVRRGLLGVTMRALTPDIAESLGIKDTRGALVTEVARGSAADTAGIKAGDVITGINGQAVKSSSELRNAIGLLRIGDRIELNVIRDAKPRRIAAVIPEPPNAADNAAADPSRAPNDVTALHPLLAGATLADAPEGGVLVRAIEPRSAAARAQLLRVGDRIEGANRLAVENLRQLRHRAAQRFVGADRTPRQRGRSRAVARTVTRRAYSCLYCARMSPLQICVLGGTGFIGTELTARLSARGHAVRVLTRRFAAANHLRVLPQIEVVVANVHDPVVLSRQLRGVDVVINLVGILNESGRSGAGFKRAHTELTAKIVAAANEQRVERILQMSSLGADPSAPSHYLRSKGAAERLLQQAPGSIDYTIFRPSVVFGAGDSLTNRFASLLRMGGGWLPLARANARLQPAYVGDVAAAFVRALAGGDTSRRTYDLGGPEVMTLGELVRKTALHAGLPCHIVGMPNFAARMQAFVMDFVPGKPFSTDNYRSLSVDSVCAENGFARLGIMPASMDAVLPAYLGAQARESKLDHARAWVGRR